MFLSTKKLLQIAAKDPHRSSPVPKLRHSAVMMLFHNDEDSDKRSTKVVLIMKARDGSRHSGQIAFPGGKIEKSDRSPQETALRETAEEIGICGTKLRILGHMGYISTLTTGFDVSVFLAQSIGRLDYYLREQEVAALFEVPLAEIYRQFDPNMEFRNSHDFLKLHFHLEANRFLKQWNTGWPAQRRMICVWGFTARVFARLFQRIDQVGNIQ